MSALIKEDFEAGLASDIGGFTHDPLGFVLYAFPWGQGELRDKTGPRAWQQQVLEQIASHLQSGRATTEAVRIAVASGHGPGKSTLLAWIALWAMSTIIDARGVITANTDTQLRTKTMPELAKWYYLSINRHWFVLTATSLYSVRPDHTSNWRLDAVAWSEHNTEAFAGLHNAGKRTIVLYDEGAGISDNVWEVTEGALTDADTEMIWCVMGNPTRNTGRFRDCFGTLSHRWWTKQIDSRTVEGCNRTYLDGLVEDYGEESDFVKSRVRGVFPSAGNMQFFGGDLIDRAMARDPGRDSDGYGKIMGVDVARHGDDSSVICRRQGRKVWPFKRMKIPDLMKIADEVATQIRDWKPDTVFIDATGMGWGVCDRLRQLNFHNIVAVQVGEDANLSDRYDNKRTELHYRAREWLEEEGCLPLDKSLKEEAIAIEYGYRNERLAIEQKKTMKARGLASPDAVDAWCLTFGSPVGMTRQVPKTWRDRLQHKRSAQAA